MRSHVSLWRPAAAVLTALSASVAIAACGGSGPSHAGTSTVASARLKFATCMRAHGVPDYPDPGAHGSKITESRSVQDAAVTKCQKYQEPLFGPRPSTAQLARARIGALASSRCMRAHGFPHYSDLKVFAGPGGHGIATSLPTGVPIKSTKSPAFKAANLTCGRVFDKYLPKQP